MVTLTKTYQSPFNYFYLNYFFLFQIIDLSSLLLDFWTLLVFTMEDALINRVVTFSLVCGNILISKYKCRYMLFNSFLFYHSLYSSKRVLWTISMLIIMNTLKQMNLIIYFSCWTSRRRQKCHWISNFSNYCRCWTWRV